MATDGGIWRDSHGLALADYPRPSVAVDTALLTLQPGRSGGLELHVLLVSQDVRGRPWALPGTFVHEGERLIDAVRRSLRDKAGVHGMRPRQLHVFDDPRRDPRGWVLSVAHIDVLPPARLGSRAECTDLAPVDRPPRLPYDHRRIVKLAVAEVRERYRTAPDPDHLLGAEPFTLSQLRHVHEAVAGAPLQRDTFRRRVIDSLVPTGEAAVHGPGRPAELYRRRTGS